MAMSYGGGYLHINKDVAVAGLGAGAGVVQQTTLLALDAQGKLGPSPVPQLGGFGTTAGIVALATGIPSLVLGGAGVVHKGPLKNHENASSGAMSYGLTVLLEQGVATLLNTSGVQTPAHMADAAARTVNPPPAGGQTPPPAQVPAAGRAAL